MNRRDFFTTALGAAGIGLLAKLGLVEKPLPTMTSGYCVVEPYPAMAEGVLTTTCLKDFVAEVHLPDWRVVAVNGHPLRNGDRILIKNGSLIQAVR